MHNPVLKFLVMCFLWPTTRKAGRRVLVKAFALTRCSKSKRAVPQTSLRISWLRSKILTLMEISEVNMKHFMVGK